MTDGHDFIHPLNRPENKPENFDKPGWKPVAYPKRHTFAPVEPGSVEEADIKMEGFINEMIAEETMKKWPTISDFLRHVHESYVEGTEMEPFLAPKRIVPPGGFQTPRAVSGALYTTLYEVASKYRAQRPIMPTEITAALLLTEVLKYDVPIYYVSEELCRAVAATDLPKDFTLQDLHLPMPGMVFGFPSKFMREYIGRDLCYIAAADLERGLHRMPQGLAGTDIFLPIDIECPPKFAWQFHTYRQGKIESYVSGYWKEHTVEEALVAYGYTDYTLADAAKVAEDEAMNIKVSSLMFKLILVLNTRPALVEPGCRARKGSNKGGKHDRTELWSPNIIGAKYRAPRNETPGGHASPHWHWRRGHVTHQRMGSPKDPAFVSIASLPRREDGEVDWLKVPDETRAAFWKCHKRLWLEPTLINFDESEEASVKGAAPKAVS